MNDTAYLIGTLQRRTQSDTWALTEIRVYCVPPWGLSVIGTGKVYTLLMPPVSAKNYDRAAAEAMRLAEECFSLRQLAYLFSWRRSS